MPVAHREGIGIATGTTNENVVALSPFHGVGTCRAINQVIALATRHDVASAITTKIPIAIAEGDGLHCLCRAGKMA